MERFVYSDANSAAWFSDCFPWYAELELPGLYTLQRLILPALDAYGAVLRIYGSRDGLNYERIANAAICRLRVQIVDCIKPPKELVKEIVLEAEKAADVAAPNPVAADPVAADPIAAILPFDETPFAAPVRPEDVEAFFSDFTLRLLGEAAAKQLSFHLIKTQGDEERYCVSAAPSFSGTRVMIEANSSSALSAGLYRYLRDCCRMQVAEETRQVRLPNLAGNTSADTAFLPLPEVPLTGTAYDRIRYANNYCTLSYTMPLRDEADWENELTWLSLLGVNTILDFTGMEAVWFLFLRRIGLSDPEIEQFLVGPFHTAWQLMQNIQGFGGPLHRGFIADRAKLARKIQRKMRLLGITPVRQAFAGMLPETCRKYRPELKLYPQGNWNGIARPSMLDPTSEDFQALAALFYDCQEEIYGPGSHFYAIDPYHEGGNRPAALDDGTVAQEVLHALLKHDQAAVWMVQAWQDNPSRALLAGLTPEERQKHLMILDLSSTDNSRCGEDEFMGTPWVYCMLDMFGGRLSTHGEADVLARAIPETRKKRPQMCGVGFSAEATRQNPVLFELLFDMAWEKEPVDLTAWVRNYAERRYGSLPQEAENAWRILLETAYRDPGYPHHGGYTQIFCYRPQLGMHPGQVYNELNSDILKLPYYDPTRFYEAVKEMMQAYEDLKSSAGFRYDLQDLLRQTLNLLGTDAALTALHAYEKREPAAFEAAAARFLLLLDACDLVMRVRPESLLSDWSGKAMEVGAHYDDLTRDLFGLGARAQITTWGCRESYRSLHDYAYRQYGGLLKCFYKERWELWFARLREALKGEAPTGAVGSGNAGKGAGAPDLSLEEWFRHDWDFVMNGCPEEETAAPLDPEQVFPEVIRTVQRFICG